MVNLRNVPFHYAIVVSSDRSSFVILRPFLLLLHSVTTVTQNQLKATHATQNIPRQLRPRHPCCVWNWSVALLWHMSNSKIFVSAMNAGEGGWSAARLIVLPVFSAFESQSEQARFRLKDWEAYLANIRNSEREIQACGNPFHWYIMYLGKGA